MTFEAKDLPPPLVAEYLAKHCALLIGAGASVGAGLPQWDKLLRLMIIEAQSSVSLSDAKSAEYEKLITTGKFLTAASGLKDDLGPYFFADFIRKVFVDSKVAPTGLHKALVDLELAQFVVTTNYDTLLEKSFRKRDDDVTVCTFKEAGAVRRSLSNRQFFILKAHGDATKSAEGIILTEQDYRNILFKEPAYQHVLATMFSMYTMIFIGASMTDPELNLMLNYVSSTFLPESGPVHYAVLTKEKVTEVEKERWFKDFNIRVVPVSSADEYQELTEFVVALGQAGRSASASV
jgi:SIR2-like domain